MTCLFLVSSDNVGGIVGGVVGGVLSVFLVILLVAIVVCVVIGQRRKRSVYMKT